MDDITNVEFVLAKDVLNDYFGNSPMTKECKSAVDYINTVKGCRPYILGKVHVEVIKRIGSNNAGVIEYINSVVSDGGSITGTSSFGDEDKDLLFLAGYLAMVKHIKKIFILTHHDLKFNKDLSEHKHDDILKKLDELGVTPETEVGIISPQSFNSIKEAI